MTRRGLLLVPLLAALRLALSDTAAPLTPGEPVELDIEMCPTRIVVPKGYCVALTIRGSDYEWEDPAQVLSR